MENSPISLAIHMSVHALTVAETRILWLEFARHGSLDSLIRKVHTQNTTFPRAVLWSMFDCCEYPSMNRGFPLRHKRRSECNTLRLKADPLVFKRCLVADGIIAMAYPPRFQQRTRRNLQSLPVFGDDLPENVTIASELVDPEIHPLRYGNIVHFDLDPLNVLISAENTTRHPFHPGFQVRPP